ADPERRAARSRPHARRRAVSSRRPGNARPGPAATAPRSAPWRASARPSSARALEQARAAARNAKATYAERAARRPVAAWPRVVTARAAAQGRRPAETAQVALWSLRDWEMPRSRPARQEVLRRPVKARLAARSAAEAMALPRKQRHSSIPRRVGQATAKAT